MGNSYAVAVGAVAALFGLIFGSAINAMVWRLYVGRSWVKGRSECPDCGHKLAAKDLVPVVSWVLLGGRCRYCKARIKDHPAVELVTGLAFGLSGYALATPMLPGRYVQLALWLVILVMLMVLAVYDVRWMLLPDKVMVPLVGVALVYASAMAALVHSWQPLLENVAAAVLAGGVFYALVFFSKGRAMGGGDIKLAFAMGLILGPTSTLVALLVAFNTAAVVGIAMIAMKRRGRKDQIPFGPFLVGGTVVAFLYGPKIVSWYLHLNGLT